MKKSLLVLFLIFTNSALATPFIYTFKGEVVAPIIEDLMPVRIGDPAEYRFLVDRDLPGYQTKNGVNIYDGITYFADYLGGGPYVTLSIDEQQSWNYGFDDPDPAERIQVQGSIDAPNIYSSVYVYSYGDWTVGTAFIGHMQSRGPNNDYRDIYSSLILTDISLVESVPEPSSLALFALGAMGMIVLLNRKRLYFRKA
jgi:hypothetical protein